MLRENLTCCCKTGHRRNSLGENKANVIHTVVKETGEATGEPEASAMHYCYLYFQSRRTDFLKIKWKCAITIPLEVV